MVEIESVSRLVEAKAESVGHSVSLMAVSKTHPWQSIVQAYSLGQRLFGENRVQEIEEKWPAKEDRPEGITLSLIGHLQRNKAKKAVQLVDRIDSVDSIALIDELEKQLARLDRKLEILFELNSSGEEQKSGFRSDEELLSALDHLTLCPHLILTGLMTVGPLGGDEKQLRAAFHHTKALYDRIVQMGHPLSVLSMGMSGDWQVAVEEGSSQVRLGSAIFGARDYGAT